MIIVLQLYAAAIQSHVDISGATCMAVLCALQRAGDWQVAEAALLCALPTPPLLAHASALYRAAAPIPEHSTLRHLRGLSQRHVNGRAATTDSASAAACESEGAAVNSLHSVSP